MREQCYPRGYSTSKCSDADKRKDCLGLPGMGKQEDFLEEGEVEKEILFLVPNECCKGLVTCRSLSCMITWVCM